MTIEFIGFPPRCSRKERAARISAQPWARPVCRGAIGPGVHRFFSEQRFGAADIFGDDHPITRRCRRSSPRSNRRRSHIGRRAVVADKSGPLRARGGRRATKCRSRRRSSHRRFFARAHERRSRTPTSRRRFWKDRSGYAIPSCRRAASCTRNSARAGPRQPSSVAASIAFPRQSSSSRPWIGGGLLSTTAPLPW